MEADKQITTGVDSLINLIKKEKRVSFEDAAKILKLSIKTIESWASFLEEENEILVEYKFTTPYLLDVSLGASSETGKFEEDKELLQINSMIDEAKKKVEDENYAAAKDAYYAVNDRMHNIESEVGDAAMEKEPELHSLINDKISEVEEALKKVEAHISKGNVEPAKKSFTKIHSNLKITASQIKTMRSRVKKIKPKKIQLKKKTETEEATTPESTEVSFVDKGTDNSLKRAYELMKAGKFKESRIIYDGLSNFLNKLPHQYSERKRELSSDLVKLNRDLEINFEKKFASQVNILTKKTSKAIITLENLTKKGEIKKAEKELEIAETLISKIPEGFIEIKNELEERVIENNQQLVKKKQELYSIELQNKTAGMIELLGKANSEIRENNIEEADKHYQEAKGIFKELPEGFMHQKIVLQNRLMEVYKGLLLGEERSSIDKMKGQSLEINKTVIDTLAEVKGGNIIIALKKYEEISKLFDKLPKGFLKEKTELQNKIISLHEEIIKRKNMLVTEEMEQKSAKVYNLLKITKGYIDKKQHDLANEVISELAEIYKSLPEGFYHKKIEIHTKILDLSKRLMIESDKMFLGESDESTKAKYNNMLKLIVKYHEHIEMQEFNLLETTYNHIMLLFNELPVGFVTHNIRIHEEIQKIKDEIDLLRRLRQANNLVKQKNISEAKNLMSSINRAYAKVVNQAPEDKKLFEYIKHQYDECMRLSPAAEVPVSVPHKGKTKTIPLHIVHHHLPHIKPKEKREEEHEQETPEHVGQLEEDEKNYYRIDSLREHILKSISQGNLDGALYDLKRLIELDKERTWAKKVINLIEENIRKKRKKKRGKS